MKVGCVHPARGWDGDQAVGKIDKHINEMPAVQGKLVRVLATLEQAVLAIAPLEVMAHQQPRIRALFDLQDRLTQRSAPPLMIEFP